MNSLEWWAIWKQPVMQDGNMFFSWRRAEYTVRNVETTTALFRANTSYMVVPASLPSNNTIHTMQSFKHHLLWLKWFSKRFFFVDLCLCLCLICINLFFLLMHYVFVHTCNEQTLCSSMSGGDIDTAIVVIQLVRKLPCCSYDQLWNADRYYYVG